MKQERIYEMKKFIVKNKYVTIEDLSRKFEVSLNTVRRDLKTITVDSLFKKVHGGVEYISDYIKPFEDRNHYFVEEKYLIAKLASKEIKNNDIIFIDAGTTTQYLSEFLDPDITITVLTTSLEVINRFAKLNNVKLIVLGESYNRKTNSFVNIHEMTAIHRYNIQKSFLAATAASIDSGISNSDSSEYFFKKYITEKSKHNYLLLSHEKFDKTSLVTYADLNQMNIIITDKKLDKKYSDFFIKNNISVKYPENNNLEKK